MMQRRERRLNPIHRRGYDAAREPRAFARRVQPIHPLRHQRLPISGQTHRRRRARLHACQQRIRMRKAMQAAGVAFEVKDIPRQLRSGCGLCILLEGTEADARGWIVPEQTAALYQQNGEAWRCLATFPPAG